MDLHSFLSCLDGVPLSQDPTALRVKSADFSWFSPIMSTALGARQDLASLSFIFLINPAQPSFLMVLANSFR